MSGSFINNLLSGANYRIGKILDSPYRKVGFSRAKEIRLKHLPEQGQHTTTLFGKSIHFSERNGFLHSLKEIFVDEVYLQDLPLNAEIIDCGANIGLSVIYLKRLCPTARIIAFEPDDTNFSLLETNVRSFGLNNIDLRKEAIWSENTFLEFASTGTLGSKIVEAATERNTIKVKATRLRDIVTAPVDFIKLDIEGAEYQVLMDLADNLHLVQKLFIEYHGRYAQNKELNEILELVVAKGFKYTIKEASDNPNPFHVEGSSTGFDIQLNIFCVKIT